MNQVPVAQTIAAAIRKEASHYPGDDVENSCDQHEGECLAAHVHEFVSTDGIIRSVISSPERIANLTVEVLAAWVRDRAATFRALSRRSELILSQRYAAQQRAERYEQFAEEIERQFTGV